MVTKAEITANDTCMDVHTAGIKMTGRKEKYLSDEEVKKAVRMRALGIGYEKIGTVLCVSGRTVRRAINGELAYKQ